MLSNLLRWFSHDSFVKSFISIREHNRKVWEYVSVCFMLYENLNPFLQKESF